MIKKIKKNKNSKLLKKLINVLINKGVIKKEDLKDVRETI